MLKNALFFRILLFLHLGAVAGYSDTYLVSPDGAGDFPTIQEAVDFAVNGDLILLTDGVFTGEGNRNIEFMGKALTLGSKNGDPETCILDLEGIIGEERRGFNFTSFEGPDSVVRDITIQNGSTLTC